MLAKKVTFCLAVLLMGAGCEAMREAREAENLRIGQGIHEILLNKGCCCCECSPKAQTTSLNTEKDIKND